MKIEATLDLSSTPCVIDGDLVLLEQVLVNLVRNAMDADGRDAAGEASDHDTMRGQGRMSRSQ
jgi:C4-dicarboxylate-specific signal transduction histidine kinase